MLDVSTLAQFMAVAAVAAYAQTVTGFAFGVILMGMAGLLGFMPLPEAAVFVSILSMINALQMLSSGWHRLDRRALGLILLAYLPAQVVGYHLLEYWAATQLDVLKFILGAIIIGSSFQQFVRPEPLKQRSGDGSFLLAGAFAGVMGGLFSTSGPPLVYHLYRQPLPLATVRDTLVACFAVAAVVRLGQVAWAGSLPPLGHFTALGAIPLVFAATYAARRWPPAISPATLRRIVFTMLFLSGLALTVPVVIAHLPGWR